MENNNKTINLTAYMTPPVESSVVSTVSNVKHVVKINKSMTVTSIDGVTKTVNDWFKVFNNQDRQIVHCPLSPASHSNGDATASCGMNKNGDYINFKCFGCNSEGSVYFGKSKTNDESKSESKYCVPEFDKVQAMSELTTGLDSMTLIVAEMVRLLPALEKEGEEND